LEEAEAMPKIMQYLIIIPVVIILLVITGSLIANYLFKQKVSQEVENFLSQITPSSETIPESDLEGLPRCVQKWMKVSHVVGQDKINSVRMKQQGFMRTDPSQAWMPFSARQYVRVEEPGFIWSVKARGPFALPMAGRDMYYQGQGQMLIKLLSLVTVANASGDEVNQGSMLRYMAETIWYPSAALSPYIQWEHISSNAAKATMRYKGVEASGVFHFNDQGEPINFTAMRYREVNGQYELTPWSADVGNYKEFDGIKVPATGTITWKLSSGPFTWYKFEITDAEFNNPKMYKD
jgi:hypothetical protein